MRSSRMQAHGAPVEGIQIDAETRCAHWHGATDRVALRFYCCGRWFACYECHQAVVADHPPEVWPVARQHERAVLCGACGYRLRIEEYLACGAACPACAAPFNPGCAQHYHLYFETSPQDPAVANDGGRHDPRESG